MRMKMRDYGWKWSSPHRLAGAATAINPQQLSGEKHFFFIADALSRCSSVQPQRNFSSLENTLTPPSAVLPPRSRTSVSLTFTRKSTISKRLLKCALVWPHSARAVSSLPIMPMKTQLMRQYHNPQSPRWWPVQFNQVSYSTRNNWPIECNSVTSHHVSVNHMIYLANQDSCEEQLVLIGGVLASGCCQSEPAETHRHVQCCDLTLGINSGFLVLFWPGVLWGNCLANGPNFSSLSFCMYVERN